MRKCVGRGGRSAGISGRASELRGSAEAARAHAVIARKGAEQKPRKIRADQSLEAVGDRQALLAFQRRTVGHEQAFSPRHDTGMNCGAHARGIGSGRSRP